jgi:Protein of unknown function (DUF2950)
METITLYNRERGLICLFTLGVVMAAALAGWPSPSFAGVVKQKSYASPGEAVNALVSAVRADDEKEMLSILGPGGKELISSGDEAADRAGRQKFLKSYAVKNRIEKISAGKMVLHLGKDDWAMPIPVVERGKRWIFDTKAGKEEILDRRIGRNELNVMEVLHAFVAAQYAYTDEDRSAGGCGQFAQRIISTTGKHDGLYWEAKEGEEMSPLGLLVAQAAQEGYSSETQGISLSPFHGYYYRILKGQGKYAQGGAYSYVVKNKMILGFGLVAYPAQYGNSGVMSFIVNQGGVIYQKNLGKETERIAKSIKVFNPDKTWKRVEEKEKVTSKTP